MRLAAPDLPAVAGPGLIGLAARPSDIRLPLAEF